MMTKQFLLLPDEFDASLYLYKRDEKPETLAVKITDLSAAFFSPGRRYDARTNLVHTDGSSRSLYYRAENTGHSPNAHIHHRALISTIEAATGQKLTEIGEYNLLFGGATISNLNLKQALGFLHREGNLSVFAKGLSGTVHVHVEDKSIHQTLMTNIMDSLPDSYTSNCIVHEQNYTLTVSKSSIRAAWQNFGCFFLWLDGMKEPKQLPFDYNNLKAAEHFLDEIVTASGVLKGARLGEDMCGETAFFARPQDISSVKTNAGTLKIEFIRTADLKADDCRAPTFYIPHSSDLAARKLILALS